MPVSTCQPAPVVSVKLASVAVQPLSPDSTSSLHTVVPALVSAKSSENQVRSSNAASVAWRSRS